MFSFEWWSTETNADPQHWFQYPNSFQRLFQTYTSRSSIIMPGKQDAGKFRKNVKISPRGYNSLDPSQNLKDPEPCTDTPGETVANMSPGGRQLLPLSHAQLCEHKDHVEEVLNFQVRQQDTIMVFLQQKNHIRLYAMCKKNQISTLPRDT